MVNITSTVVSEAAIGADKWLIFTLSTYYVLVFVSVCEVERIYLCVSLYLIDFFAADAFLACSWLDGLDGSCSFDFYKWR